QLAQERIAEVLKRTRSSLLTRGLANVVHNTVPVAVGPRTAHVRVAEPIEVQADLDDDARSALLAEHPSRLQRALDPLGDQSAAPGWGRPLPTPLHSR